MARKPEKPVKTCELCGGEYAKSGKLSHKQWADQRYCSVICRAAADSERKMRARPPLRAVFASRYTPDNDSGCWLWAGTRTKDGYGVMRWRGVTYRAHMLSLELAGTPRPEGALACHRCDTPRCVNPEHLYWGSPADNARDAQERGRLPVGLAHHNSKLTPAAVMAIRESSAPNAVLASIYGVTRQAVHAAREGKNWRHLK